MKRNSSIIWTLIVILYIGFIFHNSLTPAVESSKQSGATLSVSLTIFHALGIKGEWLTEHLIRKMAHFGEYALLGVFLWKCLQSYEFPKKFWFMVQVWLITVLPLIDETLQLFTEGRSGQISDVWLDILGAVAGSLLVICVRSIVHKIQNQREKRGLGYGAQSDSKTGLKGRNGLKKEH